MMHQPTSTKSSSRWLNNSTKIEFFSVILVLMLIGLALTPIMTQARITNINCQIDQSDCSAKVIDQLQIMLNQPILLTNILAQLQLSNLTASSQLTDLSINLPRTLNVALTTRPPSYILYDNDQIIAVAADGNSSIWSDSNLPNDIPLINLSFQSQANLPPDIANKSNSKLHSQLLNFLNSLKISQTPYQKIELIDLTTIKIWLSSENWAVLDLTQADAIQKLSTVLNHPDFQNRVESRYNLDLRFQYPLLLKTD